MGLGFHSNTPPNRHSFPAAECGTKSVPHCSGRTEVKVPLATPEIREVMDIRQAAHYLGISADSLYRYASSGFIPAFRLGNRWRFRKSRLDEWMDRRSGLEEEAATPKLVRSGKKPVRSTRVISRSVRTGS